MAKITQIFKLNKTQYELDFVDIDTSQDTELFIDPYWISKQDCEFTIRCDLLIIKYSGDVNCLIFLGFTAF